MPTAACTSTATSTPTTACTGTGAPPRVKPLLRGVSHLAAFVVAVPAGIALLAASPAGLPTMATTVYVLSLCALLGMSALYHVPVWSERVRGLLGRMDHAAIFLLIAGTYTPIALLVLGLDRSATLLWVVWCGAAIGVIQAVFLPHLPRWATAAFYVALGWVAVVDWRQVTSGIGAEGTALIAGGGVLYTVGAAIYATKRPDPLPMVFGYHEVFHALVVAAAVLHFVCVRSVVLAAG